MIYKSFRYGFYFYTLFKIYIQIIVNKFFYYHNCFLRQLSYHPGTLGFTVLFLIIMHFNTSHVTVKQRSDVQICSCILISIHPMLLLNCNHLKTLTSTNCNFNTSHVTVKLSSRTKN